MTSSWKQVECNSYGVSLIDQETQIMRYPECSLTIPRLKFGEIGTCVLTTKRLVFLLYGRTFAYSYEITNTKSIEPSQHPDFPDYGFLTITTKSNEIFSMQASKQLIFDIGPKLIGMVTPSQSRVKKITTTKPPNISTINQTHGVAAIKQHVESDIKQKDDTLSASLQDITTLKSCAQDLISIASDLSKMTDSESSSEMSQICLAIGLTNPVTKSKGSGDQYSIALANEFSTFMNSYLPRVKDGFLSVAEAYAAYNRARGNDFISPPDLQGALDYIESKGNFPIRVETIANIRIVVPASVSFAGVVDTFLSKLGPGDFATPMMMSKKTGLPTSIAKNYLIRAEMQGVLARDDSLAGLRYYKNRFDTFELIKF